MPNGTTRRFNNIVVLLEVAARATSNSWLLLFAHSGGSVDGFFNTDPNSIPSIFLYNASAQIFGISTVMTGDIDTRTINRFMDWLLKIDQWLITRDINRFLESRGVTDTFNGITVVGAYFEDADARGINALLDRIHNSPWNKGLKGGSVPLFIVDNAGNIYCFGCNSEAKKAAVRRAACEWYGYCTSIIYTCSLESLRVEPAQVLEPKAAFIIPSYCTPG
jgi:hypothetical protein